MNLDRFSIECAIGTTKYLPGVVYTKRAHLSMVVFVARRQRARRHSTPAARITKQMAREDPAPRCTA